MLLKRLYQSVSSARAPLYSAFSSPGCGITLSVVTFLSGVLYLIYNEHNGHDVQAVCKEGVAHLESNCETAAHSNTPNITI